jgi:hypothetical protein
MDLDMSAQDWWNELRRPAGMIGIGGIALGVFGLIFSYYLYALSEKVGRISYAVEQVQVFDPSQLAKGSKGARQPLTVLDADKLPVEESVYAANIKIWNSGSAEVRASSVRQPFVIKLLPNSRVLDSDITFATRENADKFSLKAVDNQNSAIPILWESFDTGEGFAIRVVYTRSTMSDITLVGYAVGASIVASVESRDYPVGLKGWLMVSFLGIMSLGYLGFIPKIVKDIRSGQDNILSPREDQILRKRKANVVVLVLSFAMFVITTIYFVIEMNRLLRSSAYFPPF